MRMIATVALVGCLAAAGCSKPTQDKTSQDLKAVGSDTATAAKTVAASPSVKSLGSDIKQGAEEATAKAQAAAAKTSEKLKQTAKDAGDKTSDALSAAQNAAAKR